MQSRLDGPELSRRPWSFKSLRSLSFCTVSAAGFAFLAGGGQTAVEGPAVWEEVLEVFGGSPETRLGSVLLTSRYHRHCHRFVSGCQDKLLLAWPPSRTKLICIWAFAAKTAGSRKTIAMSMAQECQSTLEGPKPQTRKICKLVLAGFRRLGFTHRRR